jgi:hypothetical protein
LENPYFPFANEEDYSLAEWFVNSGTPATHIESFFRDVKGLNEDFPRTFSSWYLLRQQILTMSDGLGFASWEQADLGIKWTAEEKHNITYFRRDPLEVIRWLLEQPCHAENSVYGPEIHTTEGRRVYSEMHTGKWWWQEQVSLREPIPCTVGHLDLDTECT